jgi:hypothetical protein
MLIPAAECNVKFPVSLPKAEPICVGKPDMEPGKDEKGDIDRTLVSVDGDDD